MKILTLEVQGFRSLKQIRWSAGDLNVLVGANGTGKSNVLRLLQLASISAQGRLAKYVQTCGGMEPLLWDGRAESFSLKVKCSPPDPNRNLRQDSVTYELRLEPIGKTGDYRIGHELLGNFYRFERGEAPGPFKFLERHGQSGHIFDQQQKALVVPEESIPSLETLLSLAADPFIQNRFIPLFRTQLVGWSVYHDFHTHPDSIIRQPAVTRHEKRVAPDGQNLIPVLHTLYTGDRDFKKEIHAAMRAAFGDDFEELVFAPAGDQRIQLRVRWKSLKREQSAADLSDGTLRFLFLLTVLASPEPAPVIAIDEPETGLHPAMVPIVAEYGVEASRHAQVMFTTHSPQFLDAFGATKPLATVLKWAEGETKLSTLGGAELQEWLKEYSLGALFRQGELEALV